MIGIISAMQEEIQALLNELKNVETSEKGMRTYYTGTLFNKNVVLEKLLLQLQQPNL